MRTDRPRRRLLHYSPPLSQRGFLHGPDLSVDGFPGDDVPGAIRHSAYVRMDRAMGRNAARSRAEDFPTASGVPRLRLAQSYSARSPRLITLFFRCPEPERLEENQLSPTSLSRKEIASGPNL